MKKTIYIIFALSICLLSASAAESNSKSKDTPSAADYSLGFGKTHVPQKSVSIYKAVTTPEKYTGMAVQLVGLFCRDGNFAYLFPTSEQRRVLDTSSAINLSGKLASGEQFPDEYEGKFVTIQGTLYYETDTDRVILRNVTFVVPSLQDVAKGKQ